MEPFIMKLIQRIVGHEIRATRDDIIGIAICHLAEFICRKRGGNGKDKQEEGLIKA